MREIKFRTWDINKARFIPTDVWALVQTDFKAFGVMLKDWQDYREGEYFYSNAQLLQQCTGLKDKNGVEIYEGDIARLDSFEPPNYEVKFIEGGFCLCFLDGEFKGESAADIHYVQHAGINQSTVIGNIYENPELLKTTTP